MGIALDRKRIELLLEDGQLIETCGVLFWDDVPVIDCETSQQAKAEDFEMRTL